VQSSSRQSTEVSGLKDISKLAWESMKRSPFCLGRWDAEDLALACKIYESAVSSGLGQADPDAEVRRGERSPKTFISSNVLASAALSSPCRRCGIANLPCLGLARFPLYLTQPQPRRSSPDVASTTAPSTVKGRGGAALEARTSGPPGVGTL